MSLKDFITFIIFDKTKNPNNENKSYSLPIYNCTTILH